MRPRQLPRVLRVVGLDRAASLEQRRSAVLREVQTCFAAGGAAPQSLGGGEGPRGYPCGGEMGSPSPPQAPRDVCVNRDMCGTCQAGLLSALFVGRPLNRGLADVVLLVPFLFLYASVQTLAPCTAHSSLHSS